MKFNLYKKAIGLLIFSFSVAATSAVNASLPEQQTCQEITAIARSAMVVLSSVCKTENAKIDFAANLARCLNSVPNNYIAHTYKDTLKSQAAKTAQLSFLANMISDVIKPAELIDGKVAEKKERTKAKRVVLTLLALAESIPAIWAAFGDGRSENKEKNLLELSAFAAVVHSIAATEDKYTKVVNTCVLIMMFYYWSKDHVAQAEKHMEKEHGQELYGQLSDSIHKLPPPLPAPTLQLTLSTQPDDYGYRYIATQEHPGCSQIAINDQGDILLDGGFLANKSVWISANDPDIATKSTPVAWQAYQQALQDGLIQKPVQ